MLQNKLMGYCGVGR